MHELWYAIVAVMLTAYVILDGFDFGAGALHPWIARNDAERRTVLAAIGPFWDSTFAFSSTLLPVLFGAALGNVIRGVPLNAEGWFQLTLFTSFLPRNPVGILDWYTVLAGVFALIALLGHGAAWLAWRASGPVAERAAALTPRFYLVLAVLWPLATVLTNLVNPALFAALPGRPLAWLGLALAIGGIVTAIVRSRQRRPLAAFLGSSAFLAGMLIATAACLYPALLVSTLDPAQSITAHNAGTTAEGLRTALGWWVIGFPLAIGYFVLLFRIHRGRAVAAAEGEGY